MPAAFIVPHQISSTKHAINIVTSKGSESLCFPVATMLFRLHIKINLPFLVLGPSFVACFLGGILQNKMFSIPQLNVHTHCTRK